MVEVFEITEEQAKLFLELDPYRLSYLTGAGAVHSFVAVWEREGKLYPVGIATVSFEEGDARILWLYVREGCRLRGVGEALLFRICEIAGDLGVERIHVQIPGAPAGGALVNLEYYFIEKDFRRTGGAPVDYCLNPRLIPDVLEDINSREGSVEPFATLTAGQKMELSPHLRMRCGMSVGDGRYDPGSSFVCYGQDREPRAAVLFLEKDGVWFLAGSFAKSEGAAKKVLIHALNSIAEQMRVRDLAWLMDLDEVFLGALDLLLGDLEVGAAQDLVMKL